MESIKLTESHVTHSTTLRDYLKIIFRHKIIFFILPVAVVIPLYFSLELKTPIYEATVTMYIKAMKIAEADYYKTVGVIDLGKEHSQLVKSNIVVERVVKALKLYQMPVDYEMQFASKLKSALMKPGVEQLKHRIMNMSEKQKEEFFFKSAVGRLSANISAEPQSPGSSFINVHVRDFDPMLAQLLANSVSRSYVIFDLEQQIEEMKLKYGEKHATVLQLTNYINEIQSTLDGRTISDLDAIGPASIKIIEQAKGGSQVGGMDNNMLMLMSFLASIVLSIVFCFTFEILDQSIKSPKDIETFLNIPFLGSVPEGKSRENLLISDDNPKNTQYKRSYQILSEKLTLLMRDKNMKTLLLIGVGERPPETAAIIANIAIYLTQKSVHKVLIIDADLINLSLSKILNVPGKPGLADVLRGNALFIDVMQDLGSNLNFLPSGETTSNSVMLLGSPIMSDLIKKAAEQYDIVLIKAPDMSNSADGVMLSSIADGTALVIDEGKVRRQVLMSAISPLIQKKINVIGAILNNRRYDIPKIIYKFT